ncbi:MAG: hypothetical protein OXU26_18175 [Acidobacteriota bacterium]|nr:hypothetical protein [Acidobacteriota bacterium]MDE2965840.1 hypothetical protein [Acidobacteriota bacterium]
MTVVRGSGRRSNCRHQGNPGLIVAIEIQVMRMSSQEIFTWVLGAGAFLLTLWAFYRIGGWFLGRVVRDIREQIEGE